MNRKIISTMNIRSILLAITFCALKTFDARCQKVDFNHCFTVLPVAVLKVINDNQFLKDTFFNFDQRTTTTGDGSSWTGTYFYTNENYIELFDEESYKASAGFSGIAYYVENIGELATIKSKTKDNVFIDSIDMQSKMVDGKSLGFNMRL
jgi:Family of unknown function (DUF5829)